MTLEQFTYSTKPNSLRPLLSDVFKSVLNDSLVFDRSVSKAPAVNIFETDDGFSIELAAPGLKKEDFKINLDKSVLSISADKTAEHAEEVKNYNRHEFGYTSFVRSFTLPDTADQSNVQAEYTDGVLNLTIGKREDAKNVAREISVK